MTRQIIRIMAEVFERSEADIESCSRHDAATGSRIMAFSTETGILPDPFSSTHAHEDWTRVQTLLGNAVWWDSVNAGLQAWYPAA